MAAVPGRFGQWPPVPAGAHVAGEFRRSEKVEECANAARCHWARKLSQRSAMVLVAASRGAVPQLCVNATARRSRAAEAPISAASAHHVVQGLGQGTWRLARRRCRQCARPRATSSSDKQQQPDDSDPGSGSLLGSAGLFLLWGGLAAYAFFVSPNQTPLRDSYFLEKLVGLGVNDGVKLNVILQQLFLIMGVWPLVYTALLIPSECRCWGCRSRAKVAVT